MSGQVIVSLTAAVNARSRTIIGRHAVLVGVLAYLILALLRYAAIWHGGVIVGGPPDNEQHAWELAWWAFALTHGINPLITGYLSPPHHPINLMWNNSTPLLALLVLPITLLAGGVASFNALLVGSLWATTSVSFLCIRRFTDRPLAAWLAGLVFGFSPFVTQGADSGRLTWLALFFLPILFVIYVRVMTHRQARGWRLGLLAGLVLSGQFLISEELSADILLITSLMAVLMAATYRNQVLSAARFIAPVLAVTAGTFLAVCGLPLYVQFFGPGRVHGSVIPAGRVVSDLAGFVVPTPYQLLNFGDVSPAFLSVQTFLGDSGSYLGLPLLALLVFAGVRQWRDPLTRWSLVLTAMAMVLSLGAHLSLFGHLSGIPLPWALIMHLPLFSLAAPRRLMVFAYLGSAVVIARLATLNWPQLPYWVKLGALGACLLTLAPTSAWFATVNVPPFFSGRTVEALRSDSVVIMVPLPREMVWQSDAGFRFRMSWGDLIQPSASGHAELIAPSQFAHELVTLQQGGKLQLTPTLTASLRHTLQTSGASYVLVGLIPRRKTVLRLFQTLLRRGPAREGGVDVWIVRR